MTSKIAPDTEAPRERWLGALAPGKDLTRFGAAILLASAFSAVQVFVIPRRLDLQEYGQYRLFLTYVTYLGVLHLGIADGAFLRWAGRAPIAIAREWKRVGRWMIITQAVVLLTAIALYFRIPDSATGASLVALAVCALCVNVTSLAAFALQAAGDFKSAGRIAVLAPGLFVAFAVLLPRLNITYVLVAYAASCAVASVYAALRVRTMHGQGRDVETGDAADAPRIRTLVITGLPVLGANLAAALSQSADRLLLSVAAPITTFALYGFATTVTVAANAGTQALSRVALSHAARRPPAERAAFLGGFFDIIAAAYGACLIAEPLFETLVIIHLPAYQAALPIVRALTIGTPFWVATHVVLVGALQSEGFVRRQLAIELSGVALVVALCGVALRLGLPTWEVAAAATAAAAVTYNVGVVIVRRSVTGARGMAAMRFVTATVWQSVALLLAVNSGGPWARQSLVYAALASVPTWLAIRRTREHGW